MSDGGAGRVCRRGVLFVSGLYGYAVHAHCDEHGPVEVGPPEYRMTIRPRVLMLTQSLPYPPHSGVANRTLNVVRQLQVDYDVDLVPFSRANHQPDSAARHAAWRALQTVASSVAEPTPIPNEHSTVRKSWDHLRAVVSGRAYTYYEYESRIFADRLH